MGGWLRERSGEGGGKWTARTLRAHSQELWLRWPLELLITFGILRKSRCWRAKIIDMRLLARLGETVFWLALWITIPAAMLYPATLWMLSHTHYSVHCLIQGYVIGIGVLFLPTGFLVDFLYRKFFLKKRPSN
jgi:hypothetical protein